MVTPSAAYGPFQQYLAARGLPAVGGGPAAQYQRNLYDTMRNIYALRQKFFPITKEAPGLWEDYARADQGRPLSMNDFTWRAGDIMRDLYAAGPQRRAEEGLRFGITGFDPDTEAEERDITQQEQQELMSLALRPYLGGLGARMFSRRLPQQEQQFLEQQRLGTAAGQGGFLEYLRDKYGLGRFFR